MKKHLDLTHHRTTEPILLSPEEADRVNHLLLAFKPCFDITDHPGEVGILWMDFLLEVSIRLSSIDRTLWNDSFNFRFTENFRNLQRLFKHFAKDKVAVAELVQLHNRIYPQLYPPFEAPEK